jgi:hypothetical protein
MVKNLIEFYKDLLEMIDLNVDDEGNIFLTSKKMGKLPILVDGLPMVLPTNEQIKTATKIEDGKSVLAKVLFNPAEESAVRGENRSLLRFREIMERKINNSFAIIGEVMFSLLNAEKEINDPDILVFIDELNKYKAPGIKKIIDDNLLENWVKLYSKIVSLETNKLYLHNFLKKGGKIGDERFNRIAVLTFPVYEQLHEFKKGQTLYDVKLRNKDVHAYKAFHRFVFNKTEEEILAGIPFGSKHKIAPALHSLLMSYEFVKDHINGMVDLLQKTGYDVDYLEEARLKDLPMPVDEIAEFIEKVKFEIKEIPTESDLLLTQTTQTPIGQATQTVQQSEDDVISKILGNNNPSMQNQIPQNQPLGGSTMSEEDEALAKILGSINQATPPMYGPNPYPQATMPQQPFGGYQQPQYQQPMYGQPMGYQQPQQSYQQGQPQGMIVNPGMGYRW